MPRLRLNDVLSSLRDSTLLPSSSCCYCSSLLMISTTSDGAIMQMSTGVCNWPPPSAANIMATTLDLYSTRYTQRKSIHPPQLTMSARPAVDRTYALVVHVRQNIWSHGVRRDSAVNVMQIEHIRSLARDLGSELLAPQANAAGLHLPHLILCSGIVCKSLLEFIVQKCTLTLV